MSLLVFSFSLLNDAGRDSCFERIELLDAIIYYCIAQVLVLVAAVYLYSKRQREKTSNATLQRTETSPRDRGCGARDQPPASASVSKRSRTSSVLAAEHRLGIFNTPIPIPSA